MDLTDHAPAAALDPRPTAGHDSGLVVYVGLAAVVFPLVYLLSDVVETVQGDFSTFRLCLTYAGEAAIPLFVVGLCAVQVDRLGRVGILGAFTYAYAFVFFTATVMWALVAHTPSWEALNDDFGWWVTVHGAVMVIGGIAFGVATARAGVFPAWTGYALTLGVVLVAAASGLGNLERTLASAVPDAAFVGMGLTLLWRRTGASSE